MPITQQSFLNEKDSPIYVSVEPWPECFELEPGEKLTLIWEGFEGEETVQVDFINECELVVWPNGNTGEIRFIINGQDAAARSWVFKHK
jgi:hypothetical protein